MYVRNFFIRIVDYENKIYVRNSLMKDAQIQEFEEHQC